MEPFEPPPWANKRTFERGLFVPETRIISILIKMVQQFCTVGTSNIKHNVSIIIHTIFNIL